MSNTKSTIKQVIDNLPSDWLRLTTHRLDIYNEKLAKVEFLEKLASLQAVNEAALSELPTAYDYIRLGHPLSCVLEWALANFAGLKPESVISFASQTMPVLAVLRKNKFLNKSTRLVTTKDLPRGFDVEIIRSVYSYDLEVERVDSFANLNPFDGSTIAINGDRSVVADFVLTLCGLQGSVIHVINNDSEYIKEIQHVRRRESIAMTPQDCLSVLKGIVGEDPEELPISDHSPLNNTIRAITQTEAPVALGSSGLSVQYAIMMGLVHHANVNHRGQDIQFIVPPNCYGGTNDQARRVAACIENVEIVDLPVDGGKDMVTELKRILNDVAKKNAVPYIIAEIPTNPRVEIPDLEKLRKALIVQRKTHQGNNATRPVFVLDQTFCPNVVFFGDGGYLQGTTAVSYVSGSKFPSGGLCTAGYCVANEQATEYMQYVQQHLKICDNQATPLQLQILTQEIPSMNERIAKAYKNARGFVDYIEDILPSAKINFVSHQLAEANFTPSVFSIDLPTKGETPEEREAYKRELNHRLINMMIEEIPNESKHCVSYGQLKGCYWTIPATSTQGTTKENDKDYIVRVSVAADFDLEKHKQVFKKFVDSL
jgi:cystathionine beta-lyase/cystathionine gamma-synthase